MQSLRRHDRRSSAIGSGGLTYIRFGSKADMCSATAYVCFVPEADITV